MQMQEDAVKSGALRPGRSPSCCAWQVALRAHSKLSFRRASTERIRETIEMQ